MHSTKTPRKRYRVMVEGADHSGAFLGTYEAVAVSQDSLLAALRAKSEAEGWTLIAIEELQILAEDVSDPVNIRRVTGRAYFDEGGS